jgi:hypothetical protein
MSDGETDQNEKTTEGSRDITKGYEGFEISIELFL